jgi:[ribosomal protein S5]-alanine N-acetyltransferase
VAPWARGQGVAARALRLLCRFGFDQLRLARVEVTIEPENTASRATAEAVGFREEGLLRSYLTIAGARRDMLMYSLLPADLQPPDV